VQTRPGSSREDGPVTTGDGWPLRPATDADRSGARALLAAGLAFDIAPGPFRGVDASDLLEAVWDPLADDGTSVGDVVRLVSVLDAEVAVGVGGGVDGGAVAVPAGLVTASVGAPLRAAPASGGDAPVGHLNLLVVHPSLRRRGLGRVLLDTAVDELRRRGAGSVTTAPRPPRYGWPGADIRYTAFGLLAVAAGFEPGGHRHNATVDLDAASRDGLLDTAADVEALRAAGVEVRRATPADAAALDRAAAVLGGTWPAEAALSLRREPVAVHLALRGPDVVGFACHAGSRHGWLGPVGVAPEKRRRGIARVLVRRCLVDVRAEGRAAAQVCWVGPVGFYADAVGGYLDRTFDTHAKTV